MKKLIQLILYLVIIFNGCRKPDEIKIQFPREISVIKGNNQIGYPNFLLKDTIIIKIVPQDSSDLKYYSFNIDQLVDNGNVSSKSYIVDDTLYIKVAWILGMPGEIQKLTFNLYFNCNSLNNRCEPIDSLIITATMKEPWSLLFSYNDGIFRHGELTDIYFSDDKNGFVVGDYYTGYLKTQDGGKTWNFASTIRDDFYKVYFSDKDTGLVVTLNNWIYFTYDGGQSFFRVQGSSPNLASPDYHMVNTKEIYSVGSLGTILKSTDGGKTWIKYLGFSFINSLYSVTCTNSEICYACGEVGKVVKTSDGGNTWKEKEISVN